MRKFIKFFKKLNPDILFVIFLIAYIVILFGLSFFRDMVRDETLYFQETYLISELFKTGKWIGDYGVGIHGFLFKIPPALIFMLTGPSIWVVTIYHILLTIFVAFLAYKFFTLILKNKFWGVLATGFLLSNFHFVLSAATYLREIPSMIVIFLFLLSFLKKKKDYIIGLIFLLLLDTKEYIFLIFGLVYFIWLFIDCKEKNFFKKLLQVFKRSLITFLPSFIWIILMFTTSIIPVNMFLASTIGFIDTGFSYIIRNFSLEGATSNSLLGGREIPLIIMQDYWSSFIKDLVSVFNVILSYVGKLLYPRVFSFLSVPKVIIFPIICESFFLLRRFFKEKKKVVKEFAFLALMILIWIVIYILRASHGRYLLPIVPAIIVIFVFLLFKEKLNNKQKKLIGMGTLIYLCLGYFFETSFVLFKFLIEFSLWIMLVISLFKEKIKTIKYVLIIFVTLVSLGVGVLFSALEGQAHSYMKFGENRSVESVSEKIPSNIKYWSNNSENNKLISVIKKETYVNPGWEWQLNSKLPKSKLLKTYGEELSYSFYMENLEKFQNNIKSFNIEKVILFVTNDSEDKYPDQDYLESLLEAEWLSFDTKNDFENMTIYIFNVNL